MAAMKTLREKMADDGLTSFIVSYDYYADDTEAGITGQENPWPEDSLTAQFWAEDAGHAGEQADDSFPGARILLVETQAEYEARTGETLDYGRTENL